MDSKYRFEQFNQSAKEWFGRNSRRLARLSPTFLGIIVVAAGLLFPDQVKAIVDGHHRLAFNIAGTVLIAASLVQIILAWVIDVQAETPNPGPLKEDAFLGFYKDSLIDAVGLLAFLPNFDNARRDEGIISILKILCTIAEAYKNDKDKHKLEMNACLYLPIPADQMPEEKKTLALPFMDKDRTSYEMFLELTHWAHSGELVLETDHAGPLYPKACVSEGFMLPVDRKPQYLIFGAPWSFVNQKRSIINDITNEQHLRKLPGMQDEEVCTNVLEHFRRVTSFKSFVCLPFYEGKTCIGVVSVQTMMRFFYNEKSKLDQQMLVSMEPFLTVLALIISTQNGSVIDNLGTL